MHNLKPITALGGDTARTDHFEGLIVTERPDFALVSLAARLGQEAACVAKASQHLGQGLPAAGQGWQADPYACFWMGPDQWMVSAPYGPHRDLASDLKQVVGDSGSVTEQTDGWCRFDLSGSGLRAVLERLCNVDLVGMPPSAARRTRLEHLGCFVWCLTPEHEVAILGPRSSAESLHHALITAAKSAL